MTLHSNDDLYKINKILILYNLTLNILWTILAVMPISLFIGFNPPDIKGFVIVLIISILPFFLPNSFLDRIKFGKTTKTYEKMGVLFIQKITQNGDIVNKQIRKKFPGYRTVSYKKSSINNLIRQTFSFEKYHIMMFIIFSLTSIYALSKIHLWWAIIISIINLLYNICPILLQHYIRLKLALHK